MAQVLEKTKTTNEVSPNILEAIKLMSRGFFERGEKTFLKCPTHGLHSQTFIHGWEENVSCLKCLNEYKTEFDETLKLKLKENSIFGSLSESLKG